MKTLRILCLHGYHGSADVMRRQMAPLADGLGDIAEFVFLDAPSLAVGDFGWWHAVAAEHAAVREDAGVGPGARHYKGWQRTREGIASAFAKQGPFDGVFGFSQGAAVTSLLVGLRSPELRFDFAVMVGGFLGADPLLAKLYDERQRYELPSVHIIGRSDAVVASGTSLKLASAFKNPLILQHDGGHVIASTPEVRQGLRSFLEARSRPDLHEVQSKEPRVGIALRE